LSSVFGPATEHDCGIGHPLQGRSRQRSHVTLSLFQNSIRGTVGIEVSRRTRGCSLSTPRNGLSATRGSDRLGWSVWGLTVERIRLQAGPLSQLLNAGMRDIGLRSHCLTCGVDHVMRRCAMSFQGDTYRDQLHEPAADAARSAPCSALQVAASPGGAGIIGLLRNIRASTRS
jgi:hypothetical protein